MNIRCFSRILLMTLAGTGILLTSGCKNKTEIMAPKAKKIPHELSLSGDTRIDSILMLKWLIQKNFRIVFIMR
jgi:hypothetical protein